MCTPLMQGTELPLLPYDPLLCTRCGVVLNPYARLDYQSRIWHCPFCCQRNPFPRSIADTNLPVELFPTYTTVEYSSPSSLLHPPASPAFVFVVDVSTSDDELRLLKNELLLLLHHLPDNALVALLTFDSMVYLHDLRFSHCSRLVVFHGDRQISSNQIRQFLNVSRPHQLHLGQTPSVPKQGFLLPISECEFSITAAIEDIHSTCNLKSGSRSPRSTGAAISATLGLLECCLVNTGSRIMVFTSGLWSSLIV